MAVKEVKMMWLGADGTLHYIDKEKFDKALGNIEKVVDCGIKVATVSGITFLCGGNVYAAGTTSIAEGLQPIINVIADCAEPICYGYMIKGFLKVGQGKDEEGKKVLKDAGMGFLGVKFIPQIMAFLRNLQLFA